MNKFEENLNHPIFCNNFSHRTKTKYALRKEIFIQKPLYQTNFSQYCTSYREPNL